MRGYEFLMARDVPGALAFYQSKRAGIVRVPSRVHRWITVLRNLGRHDDAVELVPHLQGDENFTMFVAGTRLVQAMSRGADLDEALTTVPIEEAGLDRAMIGRAAAQFPIGVPAPECRHLAICGVAFCGSTLLDRIMGGLPGVASIGESHWLIRGWDGTAVVPIDFADPYGKTVPQCALCGPSCAVLTPEFRASLALDPVDWYQKIAARLGVGTLVSADKNLMKLVTHDPLLRMDALVVFKSPQQAWASNYSKLPAGTTPEQAFDALTRYIKTWSDAYRDMLDRFAPKGARVFLDFDAFANDPEPVLRQACDRLGIAFDAGALTDTLQGHSIGGNKKAMNGLRENGDRIFVRPLGEARIPAEHAAWIEADPEIMRLHERLVAASVTGDAPRAGMASNADMPAAPAAVSTGSSPAPSVMAATDATSGNDLALTLPIFPIPGVHPDRLPGVFADFAANATAAAGSTADNRGGQKRRAFFEWLAKEFRSDDFAAIQKAHLNERELRGVANELKYLDTPFWAGSKLDHALGLGLEGAEKLDILDIGTGPGHFQLVSRYLGHESLGLDIPLPMHVSTADRHIYYDMCEFFGAKKIDHRIMAREPLPDFGRKFDLVTSLMSFFAMGPKDAAWTVDDWKFFIADLRRYMTPTARLYLTLTQSGSTAETWAWLSERASSSREASRMLLFNDMAVFDA